MPMLGLKSAIWDVLAKANEMRLADYFAHHLPEGNTPRDRIVAGVSIGIQDTIEEQLTIIQKRVDEGYQRIKLKIAPRLGCRIGEGSARPVPRYYADVGCQ